MVLGSFMGANWIMKFNKPDNVRTYIKNVFHPTRKAGARMCLVLTDEEETDTEILLVMQKRGMSLRKFELEAEINLRAEVASCGKRRAERKLLRELKRAELEKKYLSIAQKNYLAQEAEYGDEDEDEDEYEDLVAN